MALILTILVLFFLVIADLDGKPVLGVALAHFQLVHIVALGESVRSAFLRRTHKSVVALVEGSLDQGIQLVEDDGLGDGVVHACELALARVLLALVAGKPDDQDGFVVLRGLRIPDLLGGFVAIEHGHLAVHKDQFNACVLDLLQEEALVGLLPVVSDDELDAVLDDEGHFLQHLLDDELVHLVVVYDEDSFPGHQLGTHLLQLEGGASGQLALLLL